MNTGTFMAVLTPSGRGAIATLALRGPRAWEIARALFQFFPRADTRDSTTQLPIEPSTGRFWVGRLGEAGKGGSDDVVLAVRQLEPLPWLEVHCHGGDQAIGFLQDIFAKHGVIACSWQELEMPSETPRLQVLAREHLAQAPTLRTARILLDQVHGAFENAVREVLTRLQMGDTDSANKLLAELSSRQRLGRHLVEPWRVVVAGPPNAGKSSLVNALAGYSRCLVSPQPGTTRDVVTTTLAIDGWPVELADTAGRRDAAESLEREGIDRARQMAADADLCLWLLDGSTTPVQREGPSSNTALVINKIDLPAAWDWDKLAAIAQVSAQTGDGIQELCVELSRRLVPEPPPAGAAVPFNVELCEQIERAATECRARRVDRAIEVLREMRSRHDRITTR